MKNTFIIFTTILLIGISLFGAFGCQKEFSTLGGGFQTTERDGGPQFDAQNQMFNFNNYVEAKNFVKNLKVQEESMLNVRNAYSALGVDTTAEFFPNLTDHPVCLLNDQAFSFVSLRQKEEIAINNALDAGQDDVFSIVTNPYWKSILNQDGSVIIGNRIYRFFENGGVVIVLNLDWSAYNAIRLKSFDEIRQTFNIIVTSPDSDSWKNYLVLDSDSQVVQEKAINQPYFETIPTGSGTFVVKNMSLVESLNGTNTYTWKYSDGSSSTGLVPNREFAADESLSVIVSTGIGSDVGYPVSQILVPCPENVVITKLANNQFKFELVGYVGGGAGNIKMRWVFSDGWISAWDANPVFRTYTSNASVTCEFWSVVPGGLACKRTFPIVVKCGDKGSNLQQMIFTQSGQRWKLDGSIWVSAGEVGSRVKYLRWQGALLGWVPAYNQGACANLSGTYIREVTEPYKDCKDISASGSNCLGSGTFPTSVSQSISEVPTIFKKPGQLSAGLGIKVNGTWRGWGYAGAPRLILQ